jgi:hypothetical protein
MTEFRRRSIERSMRRRLGMSREGQQRLASHNERQTDWHGWCRVCRTHLTGDIVSLSRPCPNCGHGEAHG